MDEKDERLREQNDNAGWNRLNRQLVYTWHPLRNRSVVFLRMPAMTAL